MSYRTASLLALVLLGASNCARPHAVSPQALDQRTVIERYFPLLDGHIYTYQTPSGSGAEMFMIRVHRTGPNSAQWITGSEVHDLQVSRESVRRDDGGFILRTPIKKDATWQGRKGTVKVADIDARVKVPAGEWQHCIKTIEEVGGDHRGTITTFFCPDVGIARMQVEEWQGTDHAKKIMELRSFGPPMDIGK